MRVYHIHMYTRLDYLGLGILMLKYTTHFADDYFFT